MFDLPEPLIVTEHRAYRCRCGRCGGETRAPFPEGVTAPVQYGPRLLAVYLLHYELLPEWPRRWPTCSAGGRDHRPDEPDLRRARPRVRRRRRRAGQGRGGQAPGRFRIGGRTQWLHIACTVWLTFYRISPKRGSLLSDVIGIVVHDHWKPYYTMEGVLHALCNAHHLRELQALVDIEKEEWARRMQRLLRRACHATHLARDRGVPLDPRLVAQFRRRYDTIVTEGLAFHQNQPPLATPPTNGGRKRRGRPPRRTGHNLLLRLSTRKDDVLRFLDDPTVPFTNNQAERDGRMMKVRQKISGGFRAQEGARDFAVIRSLISTARKQGWNVIHALTQDPQTLISALRVA